jgi:hypothetical protein
LVGHVVICEFDANHCAEHKLEKADHE